MQPGDGKTLSVILQSLGVKQLQIRGSNNSSCTAEKSEDALQESILDAQLRKGSASTSNEDIDQLQWTEDIDSSSGYCVPDNPTAFSFGDMEADSPSDSEDELVEQLSDRIGTLRIRPGGHIRFFGSTSNFNLLELPGPDGVMNVHHRTVQNDGMKYLEFLGVEKEVPPDIEEHLTSLYFAWQDPSSHVVEKSLFEAARIQWHNGQDTPYYCKSLSNAICAVGAAFDARYHPAFVTFPRSLAEFFADRAKALLEIELDSPASVATIQTLIILSAHENGNGRDARGWLYSGMAMRLAFLLGLHQDLSHYVSKGLLTQAEVDLRKVVFWSACAVDHAWSFHIGQPFRFALKDATVTKPMLNSDRCEQWTPYLKPASSPTPVTDLTGLVCRYQASLFEAMGPLSTTVYGDMSIPKTTLQELNAQTVAGLLKWQEDLPLELQVINDDHSALYLPYVLLLYMQYHQAIIYAHRPYMSKLIAQPLGSYEARYSLRRMNIHGVGITLSAALLLLFETVCQQPSQEQEEVVRNLGTCFRALDELGSTWESAKRAREFIVRLQRHWDIQYKSNNACRRSERRRGRSSGPENAPRAFGGTGMSDVGPLPEAGNLDSASANDTIDFGLDLDLDWMLTDDLEGISPSWGSFFSVTSGGTHSRPINHVGVSVNDIEAVTKWYTEVMGFTLANNKIKHIKRSEDPGNGIFRIYPESLQEVKLAFMITGNGVGFEVFEFLDPIHQKVSSFEYNRGGFFHLCVTDPDPEGLLSKVLSMGGSKIGEPVVNSPSGSKCLYFKDPWGNAIEVLDTSFDRMATMDAV
ncbi:hypothetical protein NM208_g9942 [Fusarium decemcellulare]|uniref:Uncharacterized protein n=1 Tax=Fusarium decemcellulare TaxID=57161 RepID=A0ACC1RZP0_9HYPO|nr:hypothetical protein NM208_g9942 [Fusarium decemcellulare]